MVIKLLVGLGDWVLGIFSDDVVEPSMQVAQPVAEVVAPSQPTSVVSTPAQPTPPTTLSSPQ